MCRVIITRIVNRIVRSQDQGFRNTPLNGERPSLLPASTRGGRVAAAAPIVEIRFNSK